MGERGKCGAQLNPIGRTHRLVEDCASFGFGAPAVLRRAGLKRAVGSRREVTDNNSGHWSSCSPTRDIVIDKLISRRLRIGACLKPIL
jgi:hypothetical protein